MDGTVFDSSLERNERFSFTLGKGEVIKGWDIAVKSMKLNESAKFTISSEYAYGEKGSPPKIPPNSTLIFTIELFDWQLTDLTKNQDNGVRKRVIQEGTGFVSPSDEAIVDVDITGYYNDQIFETRNVIYTQGEGCEQNVIEGIEIAVGKMKKGEKSRVFIKPKYAWGSNPPSQFNIPSDYNEVIYEVKNNRFLIY